MHWDMAQQKHQDTAQANKRQHFPGFPRVVTLGREHLSLSEIPWSLPAPKGPCTEGQTQAADPKNPLKLLQSYSMIFLGTDRNLLLLFWKKPNENNSEFI